jgi:hypothetical protein
MTEALAWFRSVPLVPALVIVATVLAAVGVVVDSFRGGRS